MDRPTPPNRRFEAARIVVFATLAAITYGVLRDQVTTHLCVEYFTIAHPPVFPTNSPFLLAIGSGIIATWWVGLPLGVGLALAARIGPAPRLTLTELRRPIIILMVASGVLAVVAGLLGAILVTTGVAAMPDGWDEVIPPAKYVAFSADAWAHTASYASGAVGGLGLIAHTAWNRRKAAALRRSMLEAEGQ